MAADGGHGTGDSPGSHNFRQRSRKRGQGTPGTAQPIRTSATCTIKPIAPMRPKARRLDGTCFNVCQFSGRKKTAQTPPKKPRELAMLDRIT